jgi:hypothetical protein
MRCSGDEAIRLKQGVYSLLENSTGIGIHFESGNNKSPEELMEPPLKRDC